MFDDLTDRLEDALKSLRGEDKINEKNIESALAVVKRALLDADVNLDVVKEFLRELREDAIGVGVVKGITPQQKFIEIVHKRLVDVMGDVNEPLTESNEKATIILLVGLQGAGKTTAAGKLGLYQKEKGKKVLLIAADTFRPAAKDQLITLGKQIKVDVYTEKENNTTIEIAQRGVRKGIQEGYQTIIIDTAGRLYIDDELMQEVKTIKDLIKPDEVLLVVDSMIGQEAATLTKEFDNTVGITGSILTKLDGDSRGGAALSIRKISGKPIKFIGMGEKVEALEAFHPERLASRILGMGDILTLVDKAQKEVDLDDVLTIQKKFQEASFDFNDFLKQMKLIKRMGSIGGLIKMLPGMNKIDDSMLKQGEVQLKKIQTMINSMTEEERKEPILLMKSQKRRKRIAFGSGNPESEIERLITDFGKMRGMMQNLAKGKLGSMEKILSGNGSIGDGNQSRRGQESNERRKVIKKKKGFFDL